MPQLSFRLGMVVTAVIAVLSAGCASTQATWTSDSAPVAYTESTIDTVDRAPASMAIPKDFEHVLDTDNLRAQADYHFTLAETYALDGNSAQAIEEYRLTLTYDADSVQVRLRLAGEYVKQGMVNEAVKHVKSAVELKPDHVEARMLLGGLYSSLRMYNEALTEYEVVQKLDSQNYDAPMFTGALLAEQKKFAEATVRFDKLAKDANNPNAHIAWYYLARVRLEENKTDVGGKAEHALQQSIAAKPSFADSVLALGSLFESTGRKDKALSLYANFQEKHGPHPLVAEPLAQLYLEREEHGKALQELAVLEASDDEDLNVKVKIASILMYQKRYAESIVKLEDILSKMPSADKVRFYLGAVYEEVQDYRAAIPHFLKIPLASSYFAESRIHASYLYKLVGDSDKAVTTMEEAIKEKPDHAPFYALYASHLDDRREYKKGLAMLEEALSKFPQSAQLHYYLGSMRERTGDRAGTITAMKSVLAIDADHVQAVNFLAYTYAEMGAELEQAEKLARHASELKKNDGYVLDTLGWVLFKRGAYEESVKILEDAHRLQPNEAVIADHLGDAYYYFQMPERAKRLYEKAAALADEDRKAKQREGTSSESSAISAEKIRAKIVIVDRQSDGDIGKARRPASAK